MRVAWVCGWGLAGVLALGGCMRDPYVSSAGDRRVGYWRVATQTDRVTGATLPNVSVTALASNSYVDHPKPATMHLTCFDGRPLVRFAFGFKVGADVNTTLGYRFDSKPGRDNVPGVRFLQQDRTVVIEETADIAQFVSDMRGSQTVYVRIKSITDGRTTAEFNLEGSEAAIDAGFADCPLPARPPQASPRRVS